IEVARTGEAGGEATAVLDAISAKTGEYTRRRRRFFGRRPSRRVLSIFLAVFLTAGVVGYLVATNEGGDSGKAKKPVAPAALVPVQLTAAKDYDPIGGDGEHAELVRAAIDG